MPPIGADHVVGPDGIVHGRQCRASCAASRVRRTASRGVSSGFGEAGRPPPALGCGYEVAAATLGSNRTLNAPSLNLADATDFWRSESGRTNDRR